MSVNTVAYEIAMKSYLFGISSVLYGCQSFKDGEEDLDDLIDDLRNLLVVDAEHYLDLIFRLEIVKEVFINNIAPMLDSEVTETFLRHVQTARQELHKI